MTAPGATAPDVGTWDQPRAGGLPWGSSVEADWRAWAIEHRSDGPGGREAFREAQRLWQVADAYAHGYVKAIERERGRGCAKAWDDAAYAFGHEYERAAWLYAIGRGGFRDGYARAWEKFLAARGLA